MQLSGIPFGTTDRSAVEATEHKGEAGITLKAGMSYQVADNETPHRSATAVGAKLFIVD
jgi:hypothetical protein